MRVITFNVSENISNLLQEKYVGVDYVPEDIDDLLQLLTLNYDVECLVFGADNRHSDEDVFFVHRLRKANKIKIPIIAILKKYKGQSPIFGSRLLDTGVDYVLWLPIQEPILFSSIQAVCRRSLGHTQNIIQATDNVLVNISNREVCVCGEKITLTEKEYLLAEILALRRGRLLSDDVILDHLYNDLDNDVQKKIIHVFLCRVRKKITEVLRRHQISDPKGEGQIERKWGCGIRFLGPSNMSDIENVNTGQSVISS